MKALVKTEAGPGLVLQEMPLPTPGPNDVLIKIKKTGICGTDLHIDKWDGWAQKTIKAPLILGHEFCGEIVEIGSEVKDLKVGQFVSGEGHYVCGRCRACLAGKRHLCRATEGIGVQVDGVFAEYFSMPASNVWVHRQPLDEDVAAIFDPFGNAVHTALQFPTFGEDVLVTGAGPIGLMAGLVADFAGARNVVVTDLSDNRLNLAEKLGLKNTVNVSRHKITDVFTRLNMKEGFDVGLEMSGSGKALEDMVNAMAHGGRIAMLGTPSQKTTLDFSTIIFNMLTLQGVYGRQIFETWYAMSVLIGSGLDISGVITHRFDYPDWQEAFRVAGDGESGKVIINWDLN